MNEPGESVRATDRGSQLIVYGSAHCGDCYRSKRFLDSHDVPYEWVEIDDDPASIALVERINRGYRSVPTMVFPDGSILTEPSNRQLADKLGLNAS
jgi:glutaredoxin